MMANLILKSISCFRKFWTFNFFPSQVHPKGGVDSGMGLGGMGGGGFQISYLI